MNKDVVQGKWDQLKGEIQKTWGKITGDEIDQAKGDMKSISGLVQERYGLAKDDADAKLNDLSSRFAANASEKTDTLKEKAANLVEKAKDKLDESNEKRRH